MPVPAQDLPVSNAVRAAMLFRCKCGGSSNTAPNALSCHSFSSYSVWHGTCECLVIPQAFVERTGRNHGLSTPGTQRESGLGPVSAFTRQRTFDMWKPANPSTPAAPAPKTTTPEPEKNV